MSEPASPGGAAVPPILELRDIRAGYGPIEVVHGVSLEVAAGSVITQGGQVVQPATKKLLEPHGMSVNQVDVDLFRRTAKENIWPEYQKQYADGWDEIANFKA